MGSVGELISQKLAMLCMPRSEFADKMGISLDEVNSIINSSHALPAELADKLTLLGPSAEEWLDIDRHHRQDRQRRIDTLRKRINVAPLCVRIL